MYIYTYYKQITFNPAFSEPESHWLRGAPRPLAANGVGAGRAARIIPRRNVEVPPHLGRTKFHSRIINHSTHLLNSNKPGAKMVILRVDTAHTVLKPQPHYLSVDWLGFVKPMAPGDDRIPSTDHKSFHASKLRQTVDENKISNSIYRTIEFSTYRTIEVSIYRTIELSIYLKYRNIDNIELSTYRNIKISIYRNIEFSIRYF